MNIIIQYVQIKLRPMGIHHSPHTHPTPIPMGIPIPTAALVKTTANVARVQELICSHGVAPASSVIRFH